MELNWVDYIILGIFFFSALAGMGRGFVREIVGLITLVASVLVASLFSHPLALKFTQSDGVQGAVSQASNAIGVNTAEPVSYMAIGFSFILLFVGTYIIGSLIGYFLNMIFQYGILGLGNRLLGAVFGVLRGAVICVVVLFLVQLTPFKDNAAYRQSHLVASFQPAVVWVANMAAPGIASMREKVGSSVQEVGTTIQDMI